ncbi:MAG: class I SAM-dependent methyltransferase [Bacteroidetes bacterium]|nr:class I SAM-dependent methyltransferase [Bacteroidota bacterium]MCL5738937.1 class I SAM-dependent methyltransferase [Bacteroidota bacterium]
MRTKPSFHLTQTDLFELEAESAPPYTVSAPIYDHMMREVDYPSWAKYILMLMKLAGKETRRSKIKDTKLCELACGTGNISLIMSKLGYDVTGIDSSKQMLEVAQTKLSRTRRRNACFINHDMVTYSSKETFDTAVCVYDSINYISDANALAQFFRNVYASLKPGGVFVFDASLESNSLSDASLFTQRGRHKGIHYQRRSLYDPKTKIHTTYVRVQRKDELFEETHREYVYKLDTIRGLCGKAGFNEKFVAGDFTMLEANNESQRVHFVLVKPNHD